MTPVRKSWQLRWLEVLTLLEALDLPAKTPRGFRDSIPPGWQGVKVGNAIRVSQGNSITP